MEYRISSPIRNRHPMGPLEGPRHWPTGKVLGWAVSYKRGSPVGSVLIVHGLREREYRGYSKVRTHTALGPYGSFMPRSIEPS